LVEQPRRIGFLGHGFDCKGEGPPQPLTCVRENRPSPREGLNRFFHLSER
jgi:hypothetical protein